MNVKERFNQAKKFFPVIAFLGGFAWDSITLGRLVQSSDLVFLAVYYLVAFAFLLLLSSSKKGPKLLSKEYTPEWRGRFSYVVQFCYGSLFSALVVCYFKSSGSLQSFAVVGIMAVLLVLNEFLKKYYESFTVSLIFFSLLGTMFLNFLIPHLVGQVGFLWFLASIVVSLGVCFSAIKISRRSELAFIGPLIVSALLVVSYIFNWIPPVPLVLQEQGPCVHFSKDYSCYVEDQGTLVRLGLARPVVKVAPGDKAVYFLSSVFAPASVEAEIQHRWYFLNAKEEYELRDTISSPRMKTHGSRMEGFRTFSMKSRVEPGRWKVETAVKGGGVIGEKTFDIEMVDEAPKRILWKMK